MKRQETKPEVAELKMLRLLFRLMDMTSIEYRRIAEVGQFCGQSKRVEIEKVWTNMLVIFGEGC